MMEMSREKFIMDIFDLIILVLAVEIFWMFQR